MKRILKISGYASIICLMAFTSISAQEIKTEKNIKVIIVDDSGKKTVIDTLIKDGKESGKQVIIINDGDATHTEEHEIIMHMDSKEDKHDFEKTKYIIKRDGMVITVEGDDYNKVKEIVEDIESTLEGKKNVTAKDPAAPAEPKKGDLSL